MKTLYTTQATAKGGRNGKVETADGVLSVEVRMPKELGGVGEGYTNPEQLFAAGYSACFDSALNLVAQQAKQKITSKVTAEISLGAVEGGFGLGAALFVEIEGVEREVAQGLMEAAHKVCPYSKAINNNVDVKLTLV
ncbi:organic hydroperoxide resistance protein [Flammeovirga pectinis]|uniref:Organic hydroperoxide resistance protein n=1 Tax=Flammeovirga pectinis TaxID=2494373 RepID=A0A3S9P6U2_9BACT|nr:organic hydroperoxide resistance protein [Flammeovirga pectinis]AZQ63918.1 organic hydroperoxide resistance protein [Flammeovirga pectinis]